VPFVYDCRWTLPANTGAGYVIRRRILRRAVRYYYSWIERTLLFQLVTHLAVQFEKVFELQQQSFIERVVREERKHSCETLDKG
jgi:alanyl-tRNA synthetase